MLCLSLNREGCEMKVVRHVDKPTFKAWMEKKLIRPASLEDVWGTHHDRRIWAHPNTGTPFVSVDNAAETTMDKEA